MVEVTVNFLYQIIGELQVEKRALEVQLMMAQKAETVEPQLPAENKPSNKGSK